jgi:hypothetical protein
MKFTLSYSLPLIRPCRITKIYRERSEGLDDRLFQELMRQQKLIRTRSHFRFSSKMQGRTLKKFPSQSFSPLMKKNFNRGDRHLAR